MAQLLAPCIDCSKQGQSEVSLALIQAPASSEHNDSGHQAVAQEPNPAIRYEVAILRISPPPALTNQALLLSQYQLRLQMGTLLTMA